MDSIQTKKNRTKSLVADSAKISAVIDKRIKIIKKKKPLKSVSAIKA